MNCEREKYMETVDIRFPICDACLKGYALDPATAMYYNYGRGCGREKKSLQCIYEMKSKGIVIGKVRKE